MPRAGKPREYASLLLSRLARRFFEAGDAAAADLIRADEARPLRVLTDRFGHALEFFRSCYGSAVDGPLDAIRELQQILGELDDSCVSRARLSGLLPKPEGASARRLQAAFDRHDRELLNRLFLHWEKRWADPAERSRFLRYLAPAPPKQPRKS